MQEIYATHVPVVVPFNVDGQARNGVLWVPNELFHSGEFDVDVYRNAAMAILERDGAEMGEELMVADPSEMTVITEIRIPIGVLGLSPEYFGGFGGVPSPFNQKPGVFESLGIGSIMSAVLNRLRGRQDPFKVEQLPTVYEVLDMYEQRDFSNKKAQYALAALCFADTDYDGPFDFSPKVMGIIMPLVEGHIVGMRKCPACDGDNCVVQLALDVLTEHKTLQRQQALRHDRPEADDEDGEWATDATDEDWRQWAEEAEATTAQDERYDDGA